MFPRSLVIDDWDDASLRGERLAARTVIVERAIADGSPAALEALGLRLRRRERAVFTPTSARPVAQRGVNAEAVGRGALIVVAIAVVASVLAMFIGPSGAMVGTAAIVIISAATFSYLHEQRQKRSRACMSRWLACRCPACSYELEGLDHIPPAQVAFVELGPSACPECGVAWPLVPPALTSERA